MQASQAGFCIITMSIINIAQNLLQNAGFAKNKCQVDQFACGLSRISWTFFRLNCTQILCNGKIVLGAVYILSNAKKIVFLDHPITLCNTIQHFSTQLPVLYNELKRQPPKND